MHGSIGPFTVANFAEPTVECTNTNLLQLELNDSVTLYPVLCIEFPLLIVNPGVPFDFVFIV